MELLELGHIDLGGLDHLDLEDVSVLEREDASGALGDLLSDGVERELLDKVFELVLGDVISDDVKHLFSDRVDLRALGVRSLADLSVHLGSESNGKDAEDVSVRSLDVEGGVDHRVPLSDERAELVGREVHSPEVGQAVASLNVLNAELELHVADFFVLLEVAKRSFENTSLESFRGDASSLSSVDQGLANLPVNKDVGSLDVVPLLS